MKQRTIEMYSSFPYIIKLNGAGGLLGMMGANTGCGCGGIWKRRDSASADHGQPKCYPEWYRCDRKN